MKVVGYWSNSTIHYGMRCSLLFYYGMRHRPSLGQLEIGKVLTSDPYSLVIVTTLAQSPPTKYDP